MQRRIAQPQSVTLACWQNQQLMGYGVIRACCSGYKIDPLFADHEKIAGELFLALKTKAAINEPVYLDVPETSPFALRLAEKNGMTPVFETARVYLGKPSIFPSDRWFGVTTFELG